MSLDEWPKWACIFCGAAQVTKQMHKAHLDGFLPEFCKMKGKTVPPLGKHFLPLIRAVRRRSHRRGRFKGLILDKSKYDVCHKWRLFRVLYNDDDRREFVKRDLHKRNEWHTAAQAFVRMRREQANMRARRKQRRVAEEDSQDEDTETDEDDSYVPVWPTTAIPAVPLERGIETAAGNNEHGAAFGGSPGLDCGDNSEEYTAFRSLMKTPVRNRCAKSPLMMHGNTTGNNMPCADQSTCVGCSGKPKNVHVRFRHCWSVHGKVSKSLPSTGDQILVKKGMHPIDLTGPTKRHQSLVKECLSGGLDTQEDGLRKSGLAKTVILSPPALTPVGRLHHTQEQRAVNPKGEGGKSYDFEVSSTCPQNIKRNCTRLEKGPKQLYAQHPRCIPSLPAKRTCGYEGWTTQGREGQLVDPGKCGKSLPKSTSSNTRRAALLPGYTSRPEAALKPALKAPTVLIVKGLGDERYFGIADRCTLAEAVEMVRMRVKQNIGGNEKLLGFCTKKGRVDEEAWEGRTKGGTWMVGVEWEWSDSE